MGLLLEDVGVGVFLVRSFSSNCKIKNWNIRCVIYRGLVVIIEVLWLWRVIGL